MTQFPIIPGADADPESTAGQNDTPFESLPQLAANARFHELAEKLRELKTLKDTWFEKSGKTPSQWDQLKNEAGALALAAGAKSVAYIDLRIAVTEPGKDSLGVTAESLVKALDGSGPDAAGQPIDGLTREQLAAIVLAAGKAVLNEDVLVSNGIPPYVIAGARVVTRSGNSASTRVEWIGSKGSGGKRRAAGSGGPVQ